MKIRTLSAILAATTLTLAGCGSSGSSPGPRFDGTTGTTWETLAVTDTCCQGFSDYSPAGQPLFFSLSETTLERYDGAWSALTSPPEDVDIWPGPAWVGDSLFVIRNGKVYEYSISGDTWSTPVAGGVANTLYSQNAHDDAGLVYAIESDSPYRIVRYDPATDTVSTFDSGGLGGYIDEPRVAWDSVTKKLFIAPGYDTPLLFAFDPATGETVSRATVPNEAGDGDGTGMGDPFCSDRSGHLYAAGDTGCSDSSTVFQYDTASDTWQRIPDLPINHGCNGACTVTDDGWLYFTDGEGGPSSLHRLQLH